MKTLLVSTLAAGFLASTAMAAPMQLTDAQMDQVAAGTYHDGGHQMNGDGHDRGGKRDYGQKKGYDNKEHYAGMYYNPYYYNKNYNDNYNDNDNDNYNYNENNNYIYISIPFYGYMGGGQCCNVNGKGQQGGRGGGYGAY